MHEMSAYTNAAKVRALPNDSEGEGEEELEYPGRGATLVDWEEYHKQQMRFVQHKIDMRMDVAKKWIGK